MPSLTVNLAGVELRNPVIVASGTCGYIREIADVLDPRKIGAVTYGIDPVPFMVAAQSYGADVSELDIIGGLMGTPMELTAGVATSLPIPARAEIVIEGTVTADDLALEGPLGEFTGYYGRPEGLQPVIEVKALHMRRKPILTAALMADYPACEIGAYYAIMRSAAIWDDLERFGIPGVRKHFHHGDPS